MSVDQWVCRNERHKTLLWRCLSLAFSLCVHAVLLAAIALKPRNISLEPAPSFIQVRLIEELTDTHALASQNMPMLASDKPNDSPQVKLSAYSLSKARESHSEPNRDRKSILTTSAPQVGVQDPKGVLAEQVAYNITENDSLVDTLALATSAANSDLAAANTVVASAYASDTAASDEATSDKATSNIAAQGDITQARFDASYLQNPSPSYPALSRKLNEHGQVLLRVSVSTSGVAQAVQIEQSSGYARLDEVALSTVKQWRFIPAKRGDELIASHVLVPIVFRLDQ